MTDKKDGANSACLNDGLFCPYCQKGQLRILEALKIGSYDIICSECDGRWVDEDDVFEMK